ncbi:MAG TPA: phosphopantetheine-binding protein [Candidatus Binatia bacterium]|nr:phosphopantetheine-binding protein [Candidatus Binatia bacterium]
MGDSTANIRQWLADWFFARGKIRAGMANGKLFETDYFDAGWLTSMEVVEFVTEIELHFDMQFSDSDLQDPRFASIAGLTELILQRSTLASESR